MQCLVIITVDSRYTTDTSMAINIGFPEFRCYYGIAKVNQNSLRETIRTNLKSFINFFPSKQRTNFLFKNPKPIKNIFLVPRLFVY